ncbi:esterase OVCA2-like [Centruroides sculpturatus]|uniref:esterase OVCA2-like n=1 Tax=Centruroides sculpturatus TaxID=218467 RepID=UPI000C6E2BFF|nr:esterase OVCA2-like [Centruroides sculpturatus]
MPLKILCLHGYRQDAGYFKEKFGGFRKIVKNVAELVFIDAPHIIPNDNPAEGSCLRPGRGWWFTQKEKTFDPRLDSNVCVGFDESLQLIKETFEAHGHFDGILGFSQGAALAALLCALQQNKELEYSFNFVILIAGFISRSSYHKSLFKESISINSLHVMGETDQVIPKNIQ